VFIIFQDGDGGEQAVAVVTGDASHTMEQAVALHTGESDEEGILAGQHITPDSRMNMKFSDICLILMWNLDVCLCSLCAQSA